MASTETILKGLGVLYMTYSQEREKQNEESIRLIADVWIDLFSELDDAIFSAAIRHHIKTSKWFPKPAEIFEVAKKWEDVADGGDDWSSAWAAVKGAISRYGAWGTTDEVMAYFGDKLPAAMAEDTRTVVRRFGWRELCAMENDQESTWRAQFREAYARVRTTRVEQRSRSSEVNQLISGLAQKFSAERKRIDAPKKDDSQSSEDSF